MEIPSRIKRLVLLGRVEFTRQAARQILEDNLTEMEVLESIINAQLAWVKRSTSPRRRAPREKVFIITSFSLSGVLIYTKGVIRKVGDSETSYILISEKRAVAE